MGTRPVRVMRTFLPTALLAGALAIAPAVSADSLVSSATSAVSDPVQQVVNQVQGTVDQVQGALGPAQSPTQGPVDQVQSAVGQVAHTGGGGGSPSHPSSPASSPSSPSTSASSSTAPRSSGGSRTGGSRGTAVTRRGGGGGGAAARHARTAPRGGGAATAGRPPAGSNRAARGTNPKPKPSGDAVTRTLTKLVRVVPLPLKLVIALLAGLAVLFGLRSWLSARRARRLEEQREELLGDVGLLQRALLPEVPERIGPLATSVAYRPAEGPAAGGDFYDVFEAEGGKVAVIVGDVCGHGRQALAQTALIRYTLRAYIDAGLGPRNTLQVAGRSLANDLAGELTTVVVAVYDPNDATLTYACAGHEPPILIGPAEHVPVIAAAAPPVGAGVETGVRETRVPLPPGSTACFFTDGLVEARVEDGLVGRRRLSEMLAGLEDGEGAKALLARLAEDAQRAPDDMAACILHAVEGPTTLAATTRIEELELRDGDDWSRHAEAFLSACGIHDPARVGDLIRSARARTAEFGGAVLRVSVDGEDVTAVVVQPEMRGMVVLPPIQPGDAPDTVAL